MLSYSKTQQQQRHNLQQKSESETFTFKGSNRLTNTLGKTFIYLKKLNNVNKYGNR